MSDLLVTMLSDGAARGEIDIVRPGGGLFSVSRFRRFVGFNFVADDVAKGSLEVLTAIGRATNQGFGEAEVARAVAGLQARIDQEFQGLGSRQDSSIASALVDHHLTGSAFGYPAETHQRQSAVLSSISADDVNQHLRYLMSRSAPILVPIGSPDDDFPTAERLAEVIVEAEQAAFEGTVSTGSTVSPGDPLMDRPEAIDAVASRTIQAIDATELTYANGLVAYFVESPIAEGSFVLYTISSGGASLLEPGDGPIAELVADAVGDSGVGGFDSVDVATILADASVGAGPYIGDVDEGFSAGGAVDDADRLLARIRNAGATFLGNWTPVALGDYAAGPSHVLPTGGTARWASGLSANDFLRSGSVIEYSEQALRNISADVQRMADKEGLTAHRASVDIRVAAPCP